jgi:hypothetical protein
LLTFKLIPLSIKQAQRFHFVLHRIVYSGHSGSGFEAFRYRVSGHPMRRMEKLTVCRQLIGSIKDMGTGYWRAENVASVWRLRGIIARTVFIAAISVVSVPRFVWAAGGTGLSNADWALHCDAHGRSIYSQGNQDGILEYIFDNIGTTNRNYVEFGFNSPVHDVGTGSNTYHLYENGWRGLLLDGDYENDAINLKKEWITSDNIVSIFDKYEVPLEIDYLSIDIDSTDLWILHAILSSRKYRPRVISVEYNSQFAMNSFTTCLNTTVWDGFRLLGASFGALQMVGHLHGYSVVAVVKYLDIFLVRNDLLRGSALPRYTEEQVEGPNHGLSRNISLLKENIADFAVWYHSGGDLEKARTGALENEASWANLYRIFISVPFDFSADDGVTATEVIYKYNYTAEELAQDFANAGQRYEEAINVFCQEYSLSPAECEFARTKIRFARTSATYHPDHDMYRAVHGKLSKDGVLLPVYSFHYDDFLITDPLTGAIQGVKQEAAIREFDVHLQSYCDKYGIPDEWRVAFREQIVQESGTLLELGKFNFVQFFNVMRSGWRL